MQQLHRLTIKVNSITPELLDLNLVYKFNSENVAIDIAIDNPVDDFIYKKLEWYFDNENADPVHYLSIENEIITKGIALYDLIFNCDSVRNWWKKVVGNLESLSVEIIDTTESTYIFPWEILYVEGSNAFLFERVSQFTRISRDLIDDDLSIQDKIRVLMIISRPMSYADVPISAVANGIIGQFMYNRDVDFTILRPPTFENLENKLSDATMNNKSFHIVHFDGHGRHGSQNIPGLNPRRGYVLFEHHQSSKHVFIDGKRFGEMLSKNKVQMLVMNACRSGYVKYDSEIRDSRHLDNSIAQDIINCGVQTVVAMKYNVFSLTARSFMKSFYNQICAGKCAEEAFTIARKDLRFGKRLNTLIPILLTRQSIRFKKRSSIISKLRQRFFQVINPQMNYELFDDLILSFERMYNTNELIHFYGAIGAGKKLFALALKNWILTTRLSGRVIIKKVREGDSFSEVYSWLSKLKNRDQVCVIVLGLDKSKDIKANPAQNLLAESLNNLAGENKIILITQSKNINVNAQSQQIYLVNEGYFVQIFNYNNKKFGLPNNDFHANYIKYVINAAKGNILAHKEFQIALTKLNSKDENNDRKIQQLLYCTDFSFDKYFIKSLSTYISEKDLLALYLLHTCHFGFTKKILFSVLAIACIEQKDFDDIFKKIQNSGILLDVIQNAIFQLHPLVIARFAKECEKIQSLSSYEKSITSVISVLLSEVESANPLHKNILLKNFPYIGNYALSNKLNIFHFSLADIYFQNQNLEDIDWRLWIENGFEIQKNTVAAELSPRLLLDKLGFYFFIICDRLDHLQFQQGCEIIYSLGNINSLLDIIRKLPEESGKIAYDITCKIVIKFYNFDNHIKPLERIYSNTKRPILNEILDRLINEAIEDKLSGLLFETAQIKLQYLLNEHANILSWYFHTLPKKKIIVDSSVKHSNELILKYFEEFKYFFPRSGDNFLKYMKTNVDIHMMDVTKIREEYIHYDLRELIFGKNYKEHFVEFCNLSLKLINYFSNDPFKMDIIIKYQEQFKKSIRSKMLFNYISISDMPLIFESGLISNIDLIDRFIMKEIDSHPEKIDQDLIKELTELLDIFNLGEYDQDLTSTDRLGNSIVARDNFSKALEYFDNQEKAKQFGSAIEELIFKSETIYFLYYICETTDKIDFFNTSAFYYLKQKISITMESAIKLSMGEKLSAYVSKIKFGKMENKNDEYDSTWGLITNPLLAIENKIVEEEKFIKNADAIFDTFFTDDPDNIPESQILPAIDRINGIIQSHDELKRTKLNLFDKMLRLKIVQSALFMQYSICLEKNPPLDSIMQILNRFNVVYSNIKSIDAYSSILSDEYRSFQQEYPKDLRNIFALALQFGLPSVKHLIVESTRKENMTRAEIRTITDFSTALVEYIDIFRTTTDIPELNESLDKNELTSVNVLIYWKLKFLILELTLLTIIKPISTAPWELIDEIQTTIDDINKRGGQIPSVYNGWFYEYSLHWSIFSFSVLIGKLKKSNSFEESAILDRLAKCATILSLEYAYDKTNLSEEVSPPYRSSLVRNANRAALKEMLLPMIALGKSKYSVQTENLADNISSINSSLIND